MGRRRFNDSDWGDFGLAGRAEVAGPLIGGGVAQVGAIATKMLFSTSPKVVKWAPLIGSVLGAGVSALLAMRPGTRDTGISGIVTAALVGVPRQIEDALAPSSLKGYLGVITPEMEMAGYGGLGAQDVELLDSGSGTTGMLGTIVPEQEMNGPGDVELLGAGGFGASFLS